jgi:hypothetical protein
MTEPAIVAEIPAHAQIEAQAAFQSWQQGQQQDAIERIRSFADQGEGWATALLAWLYMQQGLNGYPQAVPYAKKAQSLGLPWIAATLFNNMINNLQGSPQLLEPTMDLLSVGPMLMSGADPVAQGWNFLSQGRPDIAVRMLSIRGPYPSTPQAWDALVAQAQATIQQVEDLAATARTRVAAVEQAAQKGLEAITHERNEVETAAKQTGLLVSSISSDAVNTLFKADAERREKESSRAWRGGIAVLVAAAAVAVLPLLLHYVGGGPHFTSNGLLAAHATSTAALGTIAGVLLARARGRDRGAQRSSDLSTAMGTMIAYSNQIADESEKQRFMLTMGQLILQAHLQPDAPPRDDSAPTWASMLAALRTPPG